MIQRKTGRTKLNNSGFSLVELLVAVAILSVVVVPIMRSFTTTAITSSRAQSMQNATSIAEKVMEQVKTIPGEDIRNFASVSFVKKDPSGNAIKDSDGNDVTYNTYKYALLSQTATTGEKFDVYVEFSDGNYDAEPDGSRLDVSDINSVKLPELYAVDSDKHIVISWEINNYDASAVETLAYKANNTKANIMANSTKKTTVTMTGGGNGNAAILAKCDVNYKYTDPSNSSKNAELNYTVFNKSVSDIAIDENEKSSGGPHVYLFYTTSKQINSSYYFDNEEIEIIDNTQTPTTEGKSYKQDLYVIMQKSSLDPNPKNPKLKLSGSAINPEQSGSGDTVLKNIGGGKWETPDTLTSYNSWEINKNCHSFLYTNFAGSVANPLNASLYKTEGKQRIYDVKVKVYKSGTYSGSGWPSDGDGNTKLAELNSTMRVR